MFQQTLIVCTATLLLPMSSFANPSSRGINVLTLSSLLPASRWRQISTVNEPFKRFWDKSSSRCPSRWNRLGGIVHDSWLPHYINCSNLVRFPKPCGMDLEKLLVWTHHNTYCIWLRYNFSKFPRNATCVVMGPDKMFSLRLRNRRFSNAMNDSGIAPSSWVFTEI
jgi:hypothetical protein